MSPRLPERNIRNKPEKWAMRTIDLSSQYNMVMCWNTASILFLVKVRGGHRYNYYSKLELILWDRMDKNSLII